MEKLNVNLKEVLHKQLELNFSIFQLSKTTIIHEQNWVGLEKRYVAKSEKPFLESIHVCYTSLSKYRSTTIIYRRL